MKNHNIDYIKRSVVIGIIQIILVTASLIINTISNNRLVSELNAYNNLSYYVSDMKVNAYIFSNVYYEYKAGVSSETDYVQKLEDISSGMLSDMDEISKYADMSGGYYTKLLSVEDEIYSISNAVAKGSEYSLVAENRNSLAEKLSEVEDILNTEVSQNIDRFDRVTIFAQGLTLFAILTLVALFMINVKNLFSFKKDMQDQSMLDSCIDELTRLWNRKYIEKILPDIASKSSKGYLFMLDMDHFKTINDTLGHDTGDEVLRDFANVAKNCLRPTDIICRLGGDEFMIFSPNISEDKQAITIYKRLRKAIRERFKDTPKDIVTLSCGAVAYDRSLDFNSNYKRADGALYYVKEHGRNNFHISK